MNISTRNGIENLKLYHIKSQLNSSTHHERLKEIDSEINLIQEVLIMKASKLMSILDYHVPFSTAESWDNVGLLIGDENQQVNGILTA